MAKCIQTGGEVQWGLYARQFPQLAPSEHEQTRFSQHCSNTKADLTGSSVRRREAALPPEFPSNPAIKAAQVNNSLFTGKERNSSHSSVPLYLPYKEAKTNNQKLTQKSIKKSLYLASSMSIFQETDRAVDLKGNGIKAALQRFFFLSLKHSFPYLSCALSPLSLVEAGKTPDFSDFSKVSKAVTAWQVFLNKSLKKLLQHLGNLIPVSAVFCDSVFCPCL